MKKIRASEISAFLYCKRSWWYYEQGIASENVKELADGSDLHYQHGRSVVMSGLIRTIALVILFIAIILLAISLVNIVL